MSHPVLVVLSRDHDLISQMPGWLAGKAEVRACDNLDELLDVAHWIAPQGIVADFRRPLAGGLQGTQVLDSLRQKLPRVQVAVVTADHGAEPVQRLLSEMRFPQLRGNIDRQAVLQAFPDLFAEPEPQPAATPFTSSTATTVPTLSTPVAAVREEAEPLASLMGISRRYETNSPQFKQVLHDLEIAARHDVTILLIGETGAGKTYLSRLIHEVSPRRVEPFLHVACGALPNDLIESELFGHTKGSFTGAHQDKEGKFLAARRGSILLDEIDVLGLEQQVKLLRVIETGEFEAVGSNVTQRSQARLIAASNLDLQPLVEKHRFRPDLYYRLNMLKFVIPPLRQRKMDIIPLARKFISQFSIKHGVHIEQIDPAVLQALMDYPWPGNVRELEHVVQRAVIYCREGMLRLNHLPANILSGTAGPTNDPTVILQAGPHPGIAPVAVNDASLGGQMALTEKDIIEQTLFKNTFSRTRTAKDLGISRVTLYNKMKKYGMLK